MFHVYSSFSFMARKLFAFAQDKCAEESADNPMLQEVLLPGHLYNMCLKVQLEFNRKSCKVHLLFTTCALYLNIVVYYMQF